MWGEDCRPWKERENLVIPLKREWQTVRRARRMERKENAGWQPFLHQTLQNFKTCQTTQQSLLRKPDSHCRSYRSEFLLEKVTFRSRRFQISRRNPSRRTKKKRHRQWLRTMSALPDGLSARDQRPAKDPAKGAWRRSPSRNRKVPGTTRTQEWSRYKNYRWKRNGEQRSLKNRKGSWWRRTAKK